MKSCTTRFLATMTLVLGTALVIPQAQAGDAKLVRLWDDCETTSFNAAFGAGTCIGNGKTTVTDLPPQLTPTSVAGTSTTSG